MFCLCQVVADHGFDVVDLHHALRRQTSHRAADGIHWDGVIHRAISNLLLWHICDAWHVELPPPDTQNNSTLRSNNDGEPREHMPRLLDINFRESSSFRRDGYSSSNYQDRNPRQRNVDFSADNFDEFRFGCLPEIQQLSSLVRQFASDLTNRMRQQSRQMPVARKGNAGRRNNRRRPY